MKQASIIYMEKEDYRIVPGIKGIKVIRKSTGTTVQHFKLLGEAELWILENTKSWDKKG